MKPAGLDGVQRDIVKLWQEAGKVVRETWPHIKRVFTDFDGHAVQNVFVETLRASPYFWGHVWAVYLIFSLVSVAFAADYDAQVANRPTVSAPTVNPAYAQFDSIAYAGALGLNQQGGLPHPCTTAPDAVSGLLVEYGDCLVRVDFYPEGMRAHGNGHLMIPQPVSWDRGEGTLVVVYEHIDGEAEPKSIHPDIWTFNNGQKAVLTANRNYRVEATQEETARVLRMGGTVEGVTQLTWTGLPDNWDGQVHIEIISWSQTDSYLMMDGVNYGSRGGLQNAGVDIPTVDNSRVQVVQQGTPRVKYIYSMMSRQFMGRALASQLSTDLFGWAD